MNPRHAVTPRPFRYGLALGCLLSVSFGLRLVIAIRGGQFFWTDEARYVASRVAWSDFEAGAYRAGLDRLFSSADHLLFKVIGVIPASIERPFGNPPWIPATFFGGFSVLMIWLVWKLALDLGGTKLEALCSAFLVSTCNAFFYYARHLFPYDLSLCIFLGSALCGLRTGRKMHFFAGMLSGIGFLCYNGYWLVGAVVLILSVFARRLSPKDFALDVTFALAGLILPIGAVLMVGRALDHNLLRSFVDFSGTTTGDLGTAWEFVPKYFWASEHGVAVFGAVAVLAAIVAGMKRRLDPWVIGPLIVFFLFYLGLVGFSDVFGHIAVYARHTRPLAVFACLIGGWFLARMLNQGRYGTVAFSLTVTGIIVQFAANIRAPIQQVFPPAFNILAKSAIDRDKAADPGLYRVFSDGFVKDPALLAAEKRPSIFLFQRPHPLQFRPYALDGFNEDQRGAMLRNDISMRAVRLLPENPQGTPQLDRGKGLWAPFPGCLHLKLFFDPGESGVPQPIVSCGGPGTGAQVFVEFVGKNRIRFGIDSWGAGATFSQTVPCDYSQPHDVVVSTGFMYPAEAHPPFREHPGWAYLRHTSLILFDGSIIYERRMDFDPTPPQSVVLFNNLVGLSSSSAAFQGRVLSVSEEAPAAMLSTIGPMAFLASGPSGTISMEVLFDPTVTGRGQPLLVSGRTGAADFIYAVLSDAHHLRIAFDHWGSGGLVGELIPFDPNSWHNIRIVLGSLRTQGSSPAIEPNEYEVIFDGHVALRGKATLYPTSETDIHVGMNPLGGSTTEPLFQGQIRAGESPR